jgi:hypothetical protein
MSWFQTPEERLCLPIDVTIQNLSSTIITVKCLKIYTFPLVSICPSYFNHKNIIEHFLPDLVLKILHDERFKFFHSNFLQLNFKLHSIKHISLKIRKFLGTITWIYFFCIAIQLFMSFSGNDLLILPQSQLWVSLNNEH